MVINVVPTLKKLFIKERERERMVANLSCMKLNKNVGNRQKSFSMSINVTKLRMEEKEFIQEPDTINQDYKTNFYKEKCIGTCLLEPIVATPLEIYLKSTELRTFVVILDDKSTLNK
jgi:hypothetical protein